MRALTFDAVPPALSVPSSARRRAALLAAVVVAGVAANGLASLVTSPVVDADLGLLLRGMAAIKGLLVLAAFGAVWWRLAQAASRRQVFGYVVAMATMGAATVLIAHLVLLVAAAVAFHAGALIALIVAWRDARDEQGDSRRRRRLPTGADRSFTGVLAHGR